MNLYAVCDRIHNQLSNTLVSLCRASEGVEEPTTVATTLGTKATHWLLCTWSGSLTCVIAFIQ
ncbi:hypothetical protein LC593_17100 [Nostoc sp. CHAB 5844]|nr:hypothetical protein [Nostoc sp. CHAB 5844]